jgi:agmatine deiminase
VTQEVVNLLAEKTDFNLIPLVAPTKLKDEDGWVDFSYVNHYVANGCVIACSFDDANDELARETLQNAYPNRKVIMVNAVALFERGGGIHCITQQQPAQSEPEKK